MPVRSIRAWILTFVLCLAAALAPGPGRPGLVRAQGLSVGWQDCLSGDGAGGANLGFGCNSSTVSFPLFPAVRLGARVDSVYAMELVIDVDVAADALPEWWRMDPGGCRENGWSADTVAPLGCVDAWGGNGVASDQGWFPGTPGASPRHGRLLVAAAAQPGEMVTLESDVSYAICRVLLRTINTFTCVGCATPACLVFNSVLIRRVPGSSIEEVFLSTPETPGVNMLTWQGGLGADCQAVPVRRRTWGAVKALYR